LELKYSTDYSTVQKFLQHFNLKHHYFWIGGVKVNETLKWTSKDPFFNIYEWSESEPEQLCLFVGRGKKSDVSIFHQVCSGLEWPLHYALCEKGKYGINCPAIHKMYEYILPLLTKLKLSFVAVNLLITLQIPCPIKHFLIIQKRSKS
jgi:hypothetical protein